jgi:glyoxylase-like metal-dependent hydrolase (beta-lactamase superfamily II)
MTVTRFDLSRRRLLGNISASIALGTVGGVPIANAAAPITNARPLEWYRARFGDFEITIASDGEVDLGDPSNGFPSHPKDDLIQLLQAQFLPTSKATFGQNCCVVNTGRHLVLFDTGVGYTRPFGPQTGVLMTNLRAAGIDPAQIDAVVCSHAHIDHVWGIVGGDGKANFPNAQVFINKADFDYWTDETRTGAAAWHKDFVQGARRNLLPVRDRLVFVEDGQEVLPGIVAMAAPGHTVGHTVFAIQSGNRIAMFTGDLAHHHVITMRRPQIEFAYDTDSRLSAQTRMRVLSQVAKERITMISYHFPFPGLGHVTAAGESFQWHPLPWGVDL